MTIDEFKKNIAPFMRTGWVVMDYDECWFWYGIEPSMDIDEWTCYNPNYIMNISYIFDIEPVEDWTKSLIKVGR